MLNKILTISIAAYNVADYIREGLESLIASKYIDDLEVFVVDDGGKDATLDIVKEYQAKYPNSIFPIHKENGGYGTTVNYSIEHATGKYFKLLDGDDWFFTKDLDLLIKKLRETESDVVVTNFSKGSSKERMKKIEFKHFLPNDRELKISTLDNPPILGMWCIAYKTEVLKKSGVILPEGLFYTDQIFCVEPMFWAKTIIYYDLNIYGYRLNRDGQSVTKESRIKNKQMFIDIFERLLNYYESNKINSNKMLYNRLLSYYTQALKVFLLSPVDKKTVIEFKRFDVSVKNISIEIYRGIEKKGKFGLFLKVLRKFSYNFLFVINILKPSGIKNWD